MPTIPTFTPRIPAPPTTGALNQGFMAIGNALQQLGNQMHAEQQELYLREAVIGARTAMMHQMYGQDGQGGYAALQGKAAYEGLPPLLQALDSTVSNFSDQYQEKLDARTMSAFQEAVAGDVMRMKQSAYKKSAMARDEYDKQLSQANIHNALNLVGTDPNMEERARKTIYEEYVRQGEKMGLDASSPMVIMNIMQGNTQLASQAVSQAINNGDYDRAQQLLAKYAPGGEYGIVPEQYAKLASTVRQNFISDQVSQITNQVVQMVGDNPERAHELIPLYTEQIFESEVFQSLSASEQAETREEINSQIEKQYRFERFLINEGEKEREKELNMTLAGVLDGARTIEDIPRALWTSLDLDQQTTVLNRLQNKDDGPYTTEQWEKYHMWRTDPNAREQLFTNPEAFREMVNDLPTTFINRLVIDMKADAEPTKGGATPEWKSTLDNRLVAQGYVGQKWAPLKATIMDRLEDMEPEDRDRFLEPSALQQIAHEEARKFQSVTREERDRIVNNQIESFEISKKRPEERSTARLLISEFLNDRSPFNSSNLQINEVSRFVLEKREVPWKNKSLLDVYMEADTDEKDAARQLLRDSNQRTTDVDVAVYLFNQRYPNYE